MGDLSGLARAPAASSFELSFVDETGAQRREPLSSCWDMPFERARPSRSFPTFKGQRNFPGLWWFATTGEHVGYESRLEHDQLMALDADPRVVGVASQPMWLHWTTPDGRERRHAPDFFARLEDGSAVLIDVRADGQIAPQDAAAFAASARACQSVGWVYRRVVRWSRCWPPTCGGCPAIGIRAACSHLARPSAPRRSTCGPVNTPGCGHTTHEHTITV
jgi:TnsA-like endonuclease N terminal